MEAGRSKDILQIQGLSIDGLNNSDARNDGKRCVDVWWAGE